MLFLHACNSVLINICFFVYVKIMFATEIISEETKVEVPTSDIQYDVYLLCKNIDSFFPPYYLDIKNEEGKYKRFLYEDFYILKCFNEKFCGNDASINEEIDILENKTALYICIKLIDIMKDVKENQFFNIFKKEKYKNNQIQTTQLNEILDIIINFFNLFKEINLILINYRDEKYKEICNLYNKLQEYNTTFFYNNFFEEQITNRNVLMFPFLNDPFKIISIKSCENIKKNYTSSLKKEIKFEMIVFNKQVNETFIYEGYIYYKKIYFYICKILIEINLIYKKISEIESKAINPENMFMTIFDKFANKIKENKHLPVLNAMKCFQLEKVFLLFLNNLNCFDLKEITGKYQFFYNMNALLKFYTNPDLKTLLETNNDVKNKYDQLIQLKENLVTDILTGIVKYFNDKKKCITAEDLKEAIRNGDFGVKKEILTEKNINSEVEISIDNDEYGFLNDIMRKIIIKFIEDRNQVLYTAMKSIKK